MSIVWVVGESSYIGSEKWRIVGIFSKEDKAREACKLPRYFIGPVEINKPFPPDVSSWPGAYHPILDPSKISLND